MGDGHSFTVSPNWRRGCQCDTLFSLAIGSPVSDQHGACWIAIRYHTVSGCDVKDAYCLAGECIKAFNRNSLRVRIS